MNIDVHTLILVLGITHIIQVAVFIHQYLTNKTFRGVGWWVMWSAAEVIGFTFMLLRGIPSIHLIAIIGQNAMLVSGVIFVYIGISRFLDKKENRGIVISLFAVFIAALLYFTYVNDDIQIRGIIISAALASVSFLSAQTLFVSKTQAITASANFIFAVFVIHGCYFATRAVMMLAGTPVNNVFAPTLINVTAYLDAIIVGILWTFGFVIMLNQRLNAEIAETKEGLEYFATHDMLTGLLNRRSLEDVLNRTVARAKRGMVSSLLYMDLDNFKDVNDTVGHSAGDKALIALVGLLKATLRTEDIVFRVGGDEFAIFLEGINGKEALSAVERLRASVETHLFELDGHVFPLTLSIGLIEIDGTLHIGELLSKADAAMYRAKEQGKNRVVIAA